MMRFGVGLLLVAWAGAAAAAGRPVTVTVKPAAAGRQLVRVSLPLPAGALPAGQGLTASDGPVQIPAGLRVLTWHPAKKWQTRSARRALVTFPYTFEGDKPVEFTFRAGPAREARAKALPVEVRADGDALTVTFRDGPALKARLVGPARAAADAPVTETVEANPYFLWQRVRYPDPKWPRVVEIRADAMGGVALVAHLRRDLAGDGYAPDFGWELEGLTGAGPLTHRFADGAPCELRFDGGRYRVYHPAAPFKRRGSVEARADGGRVTYRYLRCTADEQVPMQQAAWRRAEIVLAPASLAPLTATLESPHDVQIPWRLWDELYGCGPPVDASGRPELGAVLRFHHDATVRCVAEGDDWGNVTGYGAGQKSGPAFGMNRLNHCPPMFEEAWRTGDRRLRDAAVLWCDNFHDLSIWWGPDKTGGTRYNNLLAMNRKPIDDRRSFMWRSNSAVHFCTKGYCSFLLAYEETGDPRLREALDAQVRYAAEHVHADRGEARNIGDVDDFVRLYRYTGDRRYLGEGLRLFRELRQKLSDGDLFSQGGQPIVPDPPFIDSDEGGYRYPFAKPYIIGYALAGLPRLAEHAPREPKLRDVVRAVADFLADSQDPAGGWRYPHPRSSHLLLSQAMEHAWQITEADRLLGPQEKHLDAVERVLRQRVLGWQSTGQVLSGVTAWEYVTGKARNSAELSALYRRPADRDFTRDYAEGRLTYGSSPPEGLVFFPGVLAFYLQHRPASRLLAPARPDEPLGKLLAGVKKEKP